VQVKLTERVAIVTGGAQGIGLGIARAFLEAGAKVVLADRNEEGLGATLRELAGRFEGRLHGVVADVAAEEDVKRIVEDTLRTFGAIEILVNNAGFGGMNYFWQMSAEEWDSVIRTNLRGAFLCSKEVATVMLERKVRGRIINIASVNALLPTTGISAYCASKGGLLMFTRAAALELGPHGINVNAIGPGSTLTPLTDWFYNLEGMKEGFLEHTPKGRFGAPEDIAKVALFLASDYAEWITGQIIYADGGQSLVGLPKYLETLKEATAPEKPS
jgi:NAD(P)-dependent dehydrogenase (short-subunit alcohol dehydrogenase family)